MPFLRVRDVAPSPWDRFDDPWPLSVRASVALVALYWSAHPHPRLDEVLHFVSRVGTYGVFAYAIGYWLPRANVIFLFRILRILLVIVYRTLRYFVRSIDNLLARYPYCALRRFAVLSGWAAFGLAVAIEASVLAAGTVYVRQHRAEITAKASAGYTSATAGLRR